MSDNEQVGVLWPGGRGAVPAIDPAPRSNGLSGKRVALLWDYMFRGEEIFPGLQDALKAEYCDIEFVGYEEFGSTFGGDEHAVLESLPARLRELGIDAAISGIGC